MNSSLAKILLSSGLLVLCSCAEPERPSSEDAGTPSEDAYAGADSGADADAGRTEDVAEVGASDDTDTGDLRECDPGCEGPACEGCQENEQCDNSGSCVTIDVCEGIPSLEEATGGQIIRSDEVNLPWHEGEEPRDGFEFAEVFERQFPGMLVQQRFKLDEGEYAAMRFTTPEDLELGHSGGFPAEVLLGAGGGVRLTSISQCEGDFDASHLDSRCIRQLVGGDGIHWGLDPDGFRCPLQPDTEYYFNIVYTMAEPGVVPEDITWECPGLQFGRCGKLLLPGHNYRTPDCGPHATTFPVSVTDWPDLEDDEIGFCRGNGPQPDPRPVFPTSGDTVTWTCELPPDAQYGTAPTCSASRE